MGSSHPLRQALSAIVIVLMPGVLHAAAVDAGLHRASALQGAQPGGSAGASVWVEREARVMGTRLRIRIEAPDRSTGLRASEEALAAVREAESLLSTWRPDTELSRINRAPVGRATPVSASLAAILEEALEWSRKTEGAFEPVSGAVVDAWDLRGEGRVPPPEEVEEALRATGRDGFDFHSAEGVHAGTRLHSAAWIDAGGFGKGLALRAARRALLEARVENAILDFGGQILTLGRSGDEPGAGQGWRVSVARPDDRHRPALELQVGEGSVSVSTSGGSERFVLLGGRRWSHVVDPRTGRSVRPWGSATVVADDPMVADMVSTALFVMGPDEATAWARNRTDVAVLILLSGATCSEDGGAHGGGPASRGARWNRAMEPLLIQPHRMDRPDEADAGPAGAAARPGSRETDPDLEESTMHENRCKTHTTHETQRTRRSDP